MVHPTAVVHIQLQPVSPGIWHVVSQRSQPDSPSDSWRITVIACLWSLTSSWSHNYRMASRSINERHRRCCTRRARSTRAFYAPVCVHAHISIEWYVRISRGLLSRLLFSQYYHIGLPACCPSFFEKKMQSRVYVYMSKLISDFFNCVQNENVQSMSGRAEMAGKRI